MFQMFYDHLFFFIELARKTLFMRSCYFVPFFLLFIWLSRILLAVPSKSKYFTVWMIFRSRKKNGSAVQILLLLTIILNQSKKWKGECLTDWHRINYKKIYQKIRFIVSYENKKRIICVRTKYGNGIVKIISIHHGEIRMEPLKFRLLCDS